MNFREEKDTMGTVRVPEDSYYGAQTQRAVQNFPISGLHFPTVFIRALAAIKRCSAETNRELGLIDDEKAEAIRRAADEVMADKMADQFVVDVFQTGSGTSTNMNMNEVIACRANEILTGKKSGKQPVHPNDHVNLGQSSNDVIPSAIHLAALDLLNATLIPSLGKLHTALASKAAGFSDIPKIGRTHLQDAVPMTLGEEFSGYARQVQLGMERLASPQKRLMELALGGTAVGTGMNAHPQFAPKTIQRLAKLTGLALRPAENHFEAQAARDAVVELSGVLKTIAVSLTKIANDIRWLGSGPRCGIGEIRIPSLQPGSSIMPGKVNPVVPEAVLQVAAQVMGNDTTIMIGGQAGNFELNVMMPVMLFNLLQSIALLASAADVFAGSCIEAIEADERRCRSFIEKSLALATALVPHIGYDDAAAVAKKAYETGKTVKEVASDQRILPEEDLNEIF